MGNTGDIDVPLDTAPFTFRRATMSTQQAEEFLRALQTDPVLRSAFETADVSESGQSLAALAKAHEFDFTLEEFRERLAVAEAELASEELDKVAGGGGAFVNIDLQNSLQKQQQTLQMLSNVSRLIHDTTQAVIRRIG
jgi:predicted ribosomally synthesized peptide with nif11-like leader